MKNIAVSQIWLPCRQTSCLSVCASHWAVMWVQIFPCVLPLLKLNITLCKLCLRGNQSQTVLVLWSHSNRVCDTSHLWLQHWCIDKSDRVIPVGKVIFFFSILIGIIVIVKVTAASMLADILCLRGLDDAYSSFTAHGYWIPPPCLCF